MTDSNKGIIYIMTTVVPGLIKIGKTGTSNYEKRMYILERNGYCNVTGLQRRFAIEVEDFDDKETLLHTIFAKSQIGNTELFALDVNVALQLLSSFEGNIVYPKDESKEEVFTYAAGNSQSKFIPDGEYQLKRNKGLDNKELFATAVVKNGSWTLLKGSVLSMYEGAGLTKNIRSVRANMSINANGILTEDFKLGECSPSFAGALVINQSCNGWTNWTDKNGENIDKFRKKFIKTDDDELTAENLNTSEFPNSSAKF